MQILKIILNIISKSDKYIFHLSTQVVEFARVLVIAQIGDMNY